MPAGHWFQIVTCFALLGAHQFVVASDPDSRQPLLEQLNDDDYFTRQRASRMLMSNDQLTVEAVQQLYVLATTYEQRHRLIDVARHLLLHGLRQAISPNDPRASIGLRPGVVLKLGVPAIRVEQTFPGFPGYTHLLPGDLIIAVDDEPIPEGLGVEQLRKHFIEGQIQQHRIGEKIRLTVVRNARQIEIRFRLASLETLEKMYDKTGFHLNEPYRQHWLHLFNRLRALSPPTELLRLTRPTLHPGESESHVRKRSSAVFAEISTSSLRPTPIVCLRRMSSTRLIPPKSAPRPTELPSQVAFAGSLFGPTRPGNPARRQGAGA